MALRSPLAAAAAIVALTGSRAGLALAVLALPIATVSLLRIGARTALRVMGIVVAVVARSCRVGRGPAQRRRAARSRPARSAHG